MVLKLFIATYCKPSSSLAVKEKEIVSDFVRKAEEKASRPRVATI